MSGVLVINAGYEPLHRVSLKHAIRMLVREVAVVEEHEEGKEIGPFPFPKVLRLIRYVAMKWRHARGPAWSRRRLFARDQGTCGYCGKTGDTIDHVLPLSRGGLTEWCNTVVACRKCNHRKGNKTLEESGMKLKYANPREPSWWELNHP